MIITSREDKKPTIPTSKQEASTVEKPAPKPPSSSRHWSSAGFRNPRIVRVSRNFGGKDRHSKVCTVRGLRDRRIRLSVPTAIELYDLQDRLGLSQPSKVVDWLIEATKSDIDKLPPLQFPQGSLLSSSSSSTLPQFFDHDSILMKSNDQDQFSQKIFGLSPYSNMNYFHSSDHHHYPSLSLSSQFGLGHQFSLSTQIDANSQPANTNNSPQLFFCGTQQPNSFTQYNTDHDHHSSAPRSSSSSSSSRMTINHNHQIQLLASSNSNPNPHQNNQNSLFQNNYSLMSSLQNSSTNHDHNHHHQHEISSSPSLIKSFPAIFNPRFLSFGNSRTEKNHHDQS